MIEILTNDEQERRVEIRPSAHAPNPRVRETPALGTLIELYQPAGELDDRRYGDEEMGASDLGPIIDQALSRGDTVIGLWITTGAPRKLRRHPLDGDGTSNAGVLIVPRDDAVRLGAQRLEKAVARTLGDLNHWLAGEVYHVELQTRGPQDGNWLTEDIRGYFYGPDHARSGLYRHGAGVPATIEEQPAAGWTRTFEEEQHPERTLRGWLSHGYPKPSKRASGARASTPQAERKAS
ncbi:MAG: hypothetical protein OXG35_21400 [Acidobacteria bacterium]|nr:hypothetical protein [Acidobacteriota bacterium]